MHNFRRSFACSDIFSIFSSNFQWIFIKTSEKTMKKTVKKPNFYNWITWDNSNHVLLNQTDSIECRLRNETPSAMVLILTVFCVPLASVWYECCCDFAHSAHFDNSGLLSILLFCVWLERHPFRWDATRCTCAIVVVPNFISLKLTDGVGAADHKTLSDFLLSFRFYFASLFHYLNKTRQPHLLNNPTRTKQ